MERGMNQEHVESTVHKSAHVDRFWYATGRLRKDTPFGHEASSGYVQHGIESDSVNMPGAKTQSASVETDKGKKSGWEVESTTEGQDGKFVVGMPQGTWENRKS
ncbi:hypothetical protein HDU85_005395 [Gaertneriomyces sp. JEL0708]|nr:hypothetical protein HDU85_005395 [Gaertneriomyces sp. JEL0708]